MSHWLRASGVGWAYPAAVVSASAGNVEHPYVVRLPDEGLLRLAFEFRPERADLAEIAWSVRNAARLVPGATCLTQASAGQILLARRGHASTVRLSVPAMAGTPGKLAPHAWLMAGDIIVLGGTSQDYARHRPLHDFDLPGSRA